ncbi:hypothetical protein I3842_09G191500 [Carya illinoinensis]|uniref:Uncharacterized protein n=1 Tax=Carya illinoinensis TaxID=32201 RepID=A0A922E8A7_CARIL|nr:hypothetical protein I3842_09G191500 [Carya illinoinensis]
MDRAKEATSSSRWPFLVYVATWTTILIVVVAVASFTPEVAFASAISSSSSFSTACETDRSIRVPLDVPGETLCLPANLFSRFKIEFIVPPVFAAVVLVASACLVQATCVWDDDETH